MDKMALGQQTGYNRQRNRRGNQERTIQRNWQHWVHNTKTNRKKTQHNMCWTPPYTGHKTKTNKTKQKTQHNMCQTPICANYTRKYCDRVGILWNAFIDDMQIKKHSYTSCYVPRFAANTALTNSVDKTK